ncbi:MAG: sigma-70 family RNA polymerase sigma factor [Planctomycetota bacterium]
MPTSGNQESSSDRQLLQLARAGDASALAKIFTKYRGRLKRMIKIRMNPRLQGRLDASDVVQDTLVEAARTLDRFLSEPSLPVYFWLRHLAHEKLIEAHRRHLKTKKRDASRDLSLHGVALNATSEAVAFELISDMSSPSEAMIKKHRKEQLTQALESMSDLDREVLTLKHFEQMTNREIAELLELPYESVKKRYFRALLKLEKLLGTD